MRNLELTRSRLSICAGLVMMLLAGGCRRQPALPPGSPDNGGLALPDGFEAVVVHEGVGRARHLAVSDAGDIYVKLRVPQPKGLVALRDADGDGRAEQMEVFGAYEDVGDYGTAMRIHEGHLYFTTASEVFRQRLTPGQLVPDSPVELVLKHDTTRVKPYEHVAMPVAFDNAGHLYVPFGAPGDVCQEFNRRPGAPGLDPCPELEWHGGIWQFDAHKIGQTERDGRRYATGVRSAVAMAWNDAVGALYAVQHGRGLLYQSWPDRYSRWASALLPAEEFFKVTEGFDGGWPYYYYDQVQGRKLLNPEYGGDGHAEGNGRSLTPPILAFPGHFAPNDLVFYTGDQFPERYRQGAFIAFHGSTNRTPYSQAGYFVAFVPFADGMPSGPWEVFADGFSGVTPIPNTSDAVMRPVGLAQGPDGSLYVSDSVKGRIWRVMFTGDRTSFGPAHLARMATHMDLPHVRTPDETADVLGREQLDAGGKLYATYCSSCHQPNGKGDGARYPPLAHTSRVRGDKGALIDVVLHGLQGPTTVAGVAYNGVMPPHAFLSDDDVAHLLTYIRRSFGNLARPVEAADVAEVRARSGAQRPAR
ncbi:MAG: c-type cytochrome [Acidobacteria bacterium]|nr:c-type cytochrome [Acidobacteriota bacterium]